MFNIFGIIVALIVAEAARGTETLGLWSLAVIGVGMVFGFMASIAASRHIRGRAFELTAMQGMANVQTEWSPEQFLRKLRFEERRLTRTVPAFRRGLDTMALLMFVALCLVFGWPTFVAETLQVPEGLRILPDVAPYLLFLGATWPGQYRMDRQTNPRQWRMLDFAGLQLRGNLITLLPVVIIQGAWWGIAVAFPSVPEFTTAFYYAEFAMFMGLALIAWIVLPVLVRLVLPGGSMPDGPLRQRLDGFARERGIAVRDIRVWRTRSSALATAFVIGIVPWTRYVFITDALLARLDDDEIEAVYAHELGHAHHRHLQWFLALLLGFSVIMLGLQALAEQIEADDMMMMAMTLGVFAWALFMFSYISRRFERQADAFAAEHTSPEQIARALWKVGRGSSRAMTRNGLRHFSIRRRISEIALAGNGTPIKRMFNGELRRGLAMAVLVILASLAVLVQPVREDVVTGMATWSLSRFDHARVEGAESGRLDELRENAVRHSQGMADLDDDHARMARWYTGVIAVLDAGESDELDQLAAEARNKRDQADNDTDRDYWQRWLSYVKAGEAAAIEARRDDRLFRDVLTERLQQD